MTREDILNQLMAGTVKIEEASKLLASIEVKNGNGAPFTMKVSEKGAVSFRGVPGTHHMFGLTMYAKGVQFLIAHQKEIEAFIEKNKAVLSWEKAKAAA